MGGELLRSDATSGMTRFETIARLVAALGPAGCALVADALEALDPVDVEAQTATEALAEEFRHLAQPATAEAFPGPSDSTIRSQ